MSDPILDKAGSFLMKHLRDRGIRFAEGLVAGQRRAPALAELQVRIGDLTPEVKVLLRSVVVESIDVALHDFLHALVEASDFDDGIALRCDDIDIAARSDGLPGEVFGDDGWIRRFSKFPANEWQSPFDGVAPVPDASRE